jgi:hypothetical protein
LTRSRASTHNQTVSTPSTSRRWTPLNRLAFRFTFLFVLLYALCAGNATVWDMMPSGYRLEGWASRPYSHAAQFFAQHVLHLTGRASVLHPSGYGDRLLEWIAAGLMLLTAAVIAPLWTALDRGRTDDATLLLYLRFLLRLALAVAMFVYGAMKIFPFQVQPPSLAVLNQPVGQLSPLSLLWTTLGFNPLYERLCGSIEFLSALLLVFRRTALAGAFIAIVVLSNVCLFDFFFDVPVKLYASMLLLSALLLLVPDLRSILRFFFTRAPAAANTAWIPPTPNIRLRRTFVVLEALTLFFGCVALPLADHRKYATYAAALRNPAAITGQWHIDSALLNQHPHPYLCYDGAPMTDIFLEPNARVTGQAADHTLWGGTTYNAADHTLSLMNERHIPASFTFTQPDPNHLILTPTLATYPTLSLTRVPIAGTYSLYPLYQRGFHFANEWGYER